MIIKVGPDWDAYIDDASSQPSIPADKDVPIARGSYESGASASRIVDIDCGKRMPEGAQSQQNRFPFFHRTSQTTLIASQSYQSQSVLWIPISTRCILLWTLIALLLFTASAVGIWAAARNTYHRSDSPVETIAALSQPPAQVFHSHLNRTVHGDSEATVSLPVGNTTNHAFAITGGATGTIALSRTPREGRKIIYEMHLRGNSTLLDQVTLSHTDFGRKMGRYTFFNLTTPAPTNRSHFCLDYDVTVYIPRTLRRMTVLVETPAQVRVSPDAYNNLDELSIRPAASE